LSWAFSAGDLSISAQSVKEVLRYCFYTYHFSFLATQSTAHFFIWQVFNSQSRVQKLLADTWENWVFKNRRNNSKINNDNNGFLFRSIFILWGARWGALFLVADSCRLIGQISAFSHINRFQ
jgi:hypothetical protein